MKEILLSVTSVGAEMRGGKAAQALLAGAAAREIKLLERAFNPDIHGKRGIKSVSEQQDAVGNLPAHATQFYQFSSRFGVGQVPDAFQIKSAFGNFPRRGEQAGRAKTHLARAQFGFGAGGEALGRWEAEDWRSGFRLKAAFMSLQRFAALCRDAATIFAKAFAEQRDNLADLDNLFRRGENE